MNNRNIVCISGRLVRDAEIKPVGERFVVSFTIASNRSYKKEQDYVNETTFVDVELWSKNPTFYSDKMKKGCFTDVVGELRQKKWEKDGKKYSKIYIAPIKSPELLNIEAAKKDEPLPAEEPIEIEEPLEEYEG